MPVEFMAVSRRILGEQAEKWTPKQMRELDTRWGSNGRAPENLLKGFNIVNQDGACFWILLFQELQSMADGWLVGRIEQTITTFCKEELIIGLLIEYESGLYFEAHYRFHAMPGELCDRPGFRTMDLGAEIIDHSFPFWEAAKQNQRVNFS